MQDLSMFFLLINVKAVDLTIHTAASFMRLIDCIAEIRNILSIDIAMSPNSH